MSRIVLLALLLSITACGAGRTIAHLRTPNVGAAANASIAIKLSVRDDRTFEARPRQANVPSLPAEDIDKPGLRARALGRKRGSFGKARGAFMLPKGQSVHALVEAHLAEAVVTAGGAVVGEGDPRFASAIPLEVSVVKFWSWARPGAFAVQTEFDVELVLRGALPGLEAGKSVDVHVVLRKMAINDSRWIGLLDDGLVELDAALLKALAPAFKR